MCGIVGVFGIQGQAVGFEEVQAMCDVIIHRGPNDEGYFLDGNIGMGMRRLSVIDLETGQQPVSNEDGSVQVVMNGEIYNYRELRQDLKARGHTFSTSGDTEVIVHLYEEYGMECVQKLRGMFAFSLWDSKRRRLMLVRDRLGKKPLYYGEFQGRLVYGSEIKSLLQLPYVDRQLNWSSVGHLFSFLTTPPTESIVEGIKKLEPGHMLTIEAGQAPTLRCYWDVHFEPDYGRSEQDYVEELREILQESVRIRMRSDVPFGAFLSGGIDSSAVVAMMTREASAPVKTFSIGFTEKAFNEAPYARQVAQALGTEHHELILKPDVLDILDDLIWHLDEPFGDSSAIPTYMVSKMAAEHVTVALSGDGGDEIFAGYDKYLKEQNERGRDRIPRPVRKMLGVIGGSMKEGMKGRNFLRHIALEGNERYLDSGNLFDRDGQRGLFQGEAAERILAADLLSYKRDCLDRESGHWLSAVQYADIKNYLPLDIMTKVDRMSMAHSLEARSPLLDHKLVEFAATIPPEMKLHNGSTKHILKQAMRGMLPDSIIDRRKQGFAVPLGAWFRGEMNAFVRDLLFSTASRSRNIFNASYIERLLGLHERGRGADLQLWTMISFELWCRTFLDQPVVRKRATPRQYGSYYTGSAEVIRRQTAAAG
ncbi:MAG: asparagine synthase (glutamine-hydrolyzing) [Pseudohongiellaceae bacterium]